MYFFGTFMDACLSIMDCLLTRLANTETNSYPSLSEAYQNYNQDKIKPLGNLCEKVHFVVNLQTGETLFQIKRF